MTDWNAFEILHPKLQAKLKSAGFKEPTEVQKQVFTNYKHNKQFMIASQTGSGKTLAFSLPILSDILNNLEYYNQRRSKNRIPCLILTPTRELAIQIMSHIKQVVDEKEILVGTLLGGLSKEKQRRVLSKVPHIFIATPGRLWDFIENEKNAVLENLSYVEYLVIDEADRMAELGHFNELESVITKLVSPKTITHDKEKIKKMLAQKSTGAMLKGEELQIEPDQVVEMDYDKFIQMQQGKSAEFQQNEEEIQEEMQEEEEEEEEYEEEEEQEQQQQRQQQQQVDKQRVKKVFLVSATLTQQFSGGSKYKFAKELSKDLSNNLPKIQMLLSKLKFKQQPKIIDLTQKFLFPEGLNFLKSLLQEDDKLMYLYNYIESRKEETFIIFLNSITYANKVTSMLQVLGIKSVCLHSQQQQRQRLKRLDKFTKREINVLVCTDVAARGLDIKKVQNVIHYQIPFTVDTFVHRCGRTARIGNSGTTWLLVGPKDMIRYSKLEKDLQEQGIVDYKLSYVQVSKIQKMIHEAQKLESESHQMEKRLRRKEQILNQLKSNDDLDDEELNQELHKIENELSRKKLIINQQKQEYVDVKKQADKKFDRRRNGLFLTPSQMIELSAQLKQMKESNKS